MVTVLWTDMLRLRSDLTMPATVMESIPKQYWCGEGGKKVHGCCFKYQVPLSVDWFTTYHR